MGGKQIKCLLELNSVCPVPFNLARAFVALGSRVVEGTKIRIPSRGFYEKYLMLTVVGLEPKKRVSSRAPFYDGRHVTPRGCCCSVKQDHQFLTKISTIYIYIYIYIYVCVLQEPRIKLATSIWYIYIGGAYDKFPDFLRMGTFIDSTYMKLLSLSK